MFISTVVRNLMLVSPWGPTGGGGFDEANSSFSAEKLSNSQYLDKHAGGINLTSGALSDSSNNDVGYDDGSSSDANDVGMIILTLFFFWIFATITLVLVLKDCYKRRSPQHSDEAATALEEISEEERVEIQRMERRLWYQYFLKPYTMVRLTCDTLRLSD